jgi:hypothetical protein
MTPEPTSYVSPLGDLIDLLTVTNLRLSHSVGNQDEVGTLRDVLIEDIERRFLSSEFPLSSALNEIIVLAQLNQEIWLLKDEMSLLDASSEQYKDCLVKAHQLNGVRNQVRNVLNSRDSVAPKNSRSNTGTDGLERYYR